MVGCEWLTNTLYYYEKENKKILEDTTIFRYGDNARINSHVSIINIYNITSIVKPKQR